MMLWVYTVVYVVDLLDKSGKAVVAAAIDAYTKQSCVQIRPWTGERDYVTFTRGSRSVC